MPEINLGRVRPDVQTGNIYVVDIGSEAFDPTTLDFSQYAAGDVVLVVGNMGDAT